MHLLAENKKTYEKGKEQGGGLHKGKGISSKK
jgi:hypothetical protein